MTTCKCLVCTGGMEFGLEALSRRDLNEGLLEATPSLNSMGQTSFWSGCIVGSGRAVPIELFHLGPLKRILIPQHHFMLNFLTL